MKKSSPKTTSNLESRWERVAQDAIMAAERVECSLSEFAEGLRYIERDIKDRREMAEDEAKQQEK